MERWSGRVALVTGAGAGIGAAIAAALVKNGMSVIGCARNIQPIKDLASELGESKGKLVAYKCDVGSEAEAEGMFQFIEKNYGGADVIVNNAGIGTMTPLLELSAPEMQGILNVNIVAPVICAKLGVRSMLARKVDDGHIFNLNSMLGHFVTNIMNFYAATKFAITALNQGLRKELADKGSRIRVTSISPGRTETHFHAAAFKDEEKAKALYSSLESLTPQDVADAVIYALSAPASVQVYDVQLQTTHLGNPAAYKS